MDNGNLYVCGDCKKGHEQFESASQCCKSDHVEWPFSKVSESIQQNPELWSLGTVFSGRWEFVSNEKIDHREPAKVFPLPQAFSNIFDQVFKARSESEYSRGQDEVRKAIVGALGLN